MNSFGRQVRIHIAGESHGHGVGVMIDGLPPGLPIDEAAIQADLDRRRPGASKLVTQRQEADRVQIKSGVYEGKATGAPLFAWIDNEDTRSKDYSELLRKPRPGHSDWVAGVWARGHQDHRGGGHYSGRLTAALVIAGAIVRPLLDACGVTTGAHLEQAGTATAPFEGAATEMASRAATSIVHSAGDDAPLVAAIEAARSAKDSVGGRVGWQADGVPVALGDPFFDSIESTFAHLFFAVPAVKGVSFGSGFDSVPMTGSEHNDPYTIDDGEVSPASNNAGGILGGRTTGASLWGGVAIKPTSSIFQPQQTVDLETQEETTLELKGRHDPCIAIRAVPVIDACVRIALADALLLGIQQGHVEVPRW